MSAATKTESVRKRAGRGQSAGVTRIVAAPVNASASHPTTAFWHGSSMVAGSGRGRKSVVPQGMLAPTDNSAGLTNRVILRRAARSGAGLSGVDNSGGHSMSDIHFRIATSGKRGRKPRSPENFDGQCVHVTQGVPAINGPDLVSAPDTSRSDAGASAPTQHVTRSIDARRTSFPSLRKKGAADLAEVVIHATPVSRKSSRSNAGARGRGIIDTQFATAPRKSSASNGGVAGHPTHDNHATIASRDKRQNRKVEAGAGHIYTVTRSCVASPKKSLRKKGAADQAELGAQRLLVSRNSSSSNGGARGQSNDDAQSGVAPRKSSASDGGASSRTARDTHEKPAGRGKSLRKKGGIGQVPHVTQREAADPELSSLQGGPSDQWATQGLSPKDLMPIDPNVIISIQSLFREHRGLQRAVGDMTRRIKADERWRAAGRVKEEGGVLDGQKFPTPNDTDIADILMLRARYYAGKDSLEILRKSCLADLLEATRQLPVAKLIAKKALHGFALPSLAAVVGEAGDLSNYSNPAKLWKRFSLHVINGKAARRVKGDDSQGFVPRRRAEMHVIGDCLLRSGGPYADLYRTRKAYELEKLKAAGITVKPAARIAKGATNCMSDGQVHKRALRYIQKRLLRDLWRLWRGVP